MNADTLLESFEILAEAPYGISRLRLLIVELAIRGRFSNLEKIDGNGFPSSWDYRPASDFFKSRSGNSKLIKGKLFNEFAEGRYPGYSASGQDVWLDSAEHSGEAAILSAVGARCGKAFRASGSWSAIANTHIIWLNDKRVVPDYGMLILNNEKFWIRSGSAQPFVKVKASLEQKIGIPPLVEQRRIVTKVNELMALCDQLEKQQKQRDNLRTATRKSAIDAISTATTPEELEAAWKRINNNWEVIADTPESVGSLRSLILDLAVRGRLQNEVDQEFDLVSGFPIGWELKRLDQVCSYVQRGKGPKYADLSKYAVVSQKCVQWTGFDISKARFVDEQSLNSYGEERILRSGDILWNSTGTGTVGRTAIYFDSNLFEKVVADSHVTVLRAPDMNPQFLWSWTASPAVQSMIADLTSGTTNQQELNLSSIKSLLVPIPPLPQQNSIVAKVEELMVLCDQLESMLKSRSELAEKFAQSVVNAA